MNIVTTAQPPSHGRLLIPTVFALAMMVFLLPSGAYAQDEVPEGYSRIDWVDFPIGTVVDNYERLTSKRVIRDAAIMAGTISIMPSDPVMPNAEAIDFIEKSLLLNGYALVPSGKDMMKIIAWSGGKQPRSEGVPVYIDEGDLPDGDNIVTYIMPLEIIDIETAVNTFSQAVPNHAYGSITPLENASALVITDNASVIKNLIKLKESLDVPPQRSDRRITRTFHLEREDAETVAEILADVLDADSADNGPSRRAANASAVAQAQANIPGANGGIQGALAGAGLGAASTKTETKIVSIPRTNSVLVVALEEEMPYIESLVKHLDAPSLDSGYEIWQIQFRPVSEFLTIAQNALATGDEVDEASGTGANGQRRAAQENTNGGTTGTAGGGTRGFSLSEPEAVGLDSVVVGKTLLIADGRFNELFVSGPPEDVKVIKRLVEQFDKRPKQIALSCVIGQLTLGDDFDLGLDYLNTLEIVGSRQGSPVAGAGLLRSTAGDLIDPLDLDQIANFPNSQGLSLYGQIGRNISGYLNALEATSKFRVLSRPTQVTMNNEKAVLVTGREIAVPASTFTGGTNNGVTSNIQFREVALRIEVLPLINSDDEVTLEISITNDDIVGSTNISGNDIPTIGTQQLVSKVIIPNKSTVLLGGLISENSRETQSGIPGLVHVPLLKHLVGSTGKEVNREELLLFIQPHIIGDPSDLGDVQLDIMKRAANGGEVMKFANPTEEVKPNATVWPRLKPSGTNRATIKRSKSQPFRNRR